MTNCKNCGAPLTGGKCEYCGTEYDTICVDGTNIFYADNEPILTVDSLWYEYANQKQMSAMIDEALKRAEMRGILHR